MPCDYEIDTRLGIVRARITGETSDAELIAADDRLRQDPAFRPEFDEIVDARGAIGLRVTPEVVREITSRPPLFSEKSRRAFVVGSDLGYGMARMFSLRRGEEAGEIRVFYEIGEAEAWLAETQA